MIAHAKIFKLSYHVERALTFVMHAEGSRAGRRTLCVHCDITYQVPCTVGRKKTLRVSRDGLLFILVNLADI